MNMVMSLVGAVLVSGCVSAPAPSTYYSPPQPREASLCESFGTLATTIAEAQQAGVP